MPITLEGLVFNIPSKANQVKIYNLFGRAKDNAALTLLEQQ
ncbi:hypothetical protein [Mucilaginibacter gracilis]|nr:hypothetical protein [Mucilaginibacter gracilis]